MTYNHRKAEVKWLKWKEQEEQQLRDLGAAEDIIQRLHTYDWEQFKKERNFFEWQEISDEKVQWQPVQTVEQAKDIEGLLDNIEDEKLLAVLQKTDQQTLEMLLMWLSGYTAEEVCQKMGVTVSTYYGRIKYFKKRAKKLLGSD